jgi:uncharacterized protein YjbI with pentapeptide repeats
MKPYKYLEDDTLSKLSSPERGQLLVSLLSSRLSVTSYDMIFDRANFDYCDVPEVNFRGISLVGVNMSYSNISFADLRECNLSYSRMKGSDLAGSDLRKSTLNSTDFYRADLFATNFRGANLAGASFREANLKKTDLRNTNLLGLKISSLDAFTEVVDFPKDKFEIDTTKLKDYQGTYFLVKEKKK